MNVYFCRKCKAQSTLCYPQIGKPLCPIHGIELEVGDDLR